MKRIAMIAALAATLFAGAGCQKYNDISDRVDSLENEVNSINKQLKVILEALDSRVSVTSVTATESGYVISFTDGKTATISNGKEGPAGPQGPAGEKGDKGDSLFADIQITETMVILTLEDGRVLNLPLESKSIAAQVKSLTFIPEFSDGKATVEYYTMADAEAKMSFMVTPASLADTLVSCSFQAVGILTATRAADLIPLTVTKAEAGENGKIDVTVAVSDLGLDFFKGTFDASVSLIVKDEVTAVSSEFVPLFRRRLGEIVYEGQTYGSKLMPDGKVWMTENLRYLPVDRYMSDDLSDIDNGVWYPVDLETKEFVKDAAYVEANGLLYNMEAALNVEPGTINPTNYLMFEGAQGICPEGWHIPTLAEIVNLVGKVALHNANTPKEDAPFFDVETKNALVEKANAAGFNVSNVGYINVASAITPKAVSMNTLSYIMGSSAYTTEMGFKNLLDANGSFNNAQYFSIMINPKNGTMNGAAMNYRSGASVRCVRND